MYITGALLEYFTSRLKIELQRDVIPWQPDFLTKAITLGKLFEEKYVIDGQIPTPLFQCTKDLAST